jgi:hypothetical protein
LAQKSIIYLGDLLNKNGDLLTWADFKTKYNIKDTFLDHTKLIKQIPKEWIVALKGHVICSAPRAIPAVMILCNVKRGCRKYYEILTKKHNSPLTKPQQKWNLELELDNVNSSDMWKFAYKVPIKTTMDSNCSLNVCMQTC